MFRRAHIMWNALGAKALVPANRNWHFQPIVMNEFYYGKYVFMCDHIKKFLATLKIKY